MQYNLFGDADTMACITGSAAEAFYRGVPNAIRATALGFLDARLVHVVEEFETRFRLNGENRI